VQFSTAMSKSQRADDLPWFTYKLLYFVWFPLWHIFYLAYILTFYLPCSLTYSEVLSLILSDIWFSVLSGIFLGILSDMYSIYSDILFCILFGMIEVAGTHGNKMLASWQVSESDDFPWLWHYQRVPNGELRKEKIHHERRFCPNGTTMDFNSYIIALVENSEVNPQIRRLY